MSDTPRTDAAMDYTAPEKIYREAKKLERELREMHATALEYAASSDKAHAELNKSQWLPIDSAPKDGTEIIVINSKGTQFFVKWDNRRWEWECNCMLIVANPTHWYPKPEPPTE